MLSMYIYIESKKTNLFILGYSLYDCICCPYKGKFLTYAYRCYSHKGSQTTEVKQPTGLPFNCYCQNF